MTMKGRLFTSLSVGKPVSGNLYGCSVSTAVTAGLVAGDAAADVASAVIGLVDGKEAGVSLQPTMAMTEHPRTSQALRFLGRNKGNDFNRAAPLLLIVLVNVYASDAIDRRHFVLWVKRWLEPRL
ncbi:hypothetical protein [Paenibacillus alginolyticus]|uniref:hypothetical protein n=1 Tax=Paenibacillus alginolyticus TaxID=59839 RepID=UPI0012B589D0|nr:hypothetical protein [Paenibacillus alginolyticus]